MPKTGTTHYYGRILAQVWSLGVVSMAIKLKYRNTPSKHNIIDLTDKMWYIQRFSLVVECIGNYNLVEEILSHKDHLEFHRPRPYLVNSNTKLLMICCF